MRVLLDARQKLNIDWEDSSRQNNTPQIMRYLWFGHSKQNRFTVADLLKGIDFTTFVEVAPYIRDFWSDAAIKKTFEQRNLFQIVNQKEFS